MKVGFVQFAPRLSHVQETIQDLERLLEPVEGVDLLVLPELCNSGYNFSSRQEALEAAEEVKESRFIRFLESVCRAKEMYIVSGFNERDGEMLYNSAVLVGPQGYVGRYRKLHLFLNEKDFYRPGDEGLPVFDIGLCRLGILVCFDWIFPEVWRILALRGADLICHPANLVLPFAQRAVPIHALVNRVFVVTANRTGTERDLTFTGSSIIADPQGETILQAPAAGDMVGVAGIEVERSRDKQITPRNNVLGDRRPDQYSDLVN